MSLKKLFLSGVAAVVLGIGGLVVSTNGASAYVVCNHEGDCWHTDQRYRYPDSGYVYHPDDWYFHQTWDANHRWRGYHEGRGYWRGGVWITF